MLKNYADNNFLNKMFFLPRKNLAKDKELFAISTWQLRKKSKVKITFLRQVTFTSIKDLNG